MKPQVILLATLSLGFSTGLPGQHPLKAGIISAPPFDATLIELTETYLQQIEASLKEDPAFNAEMKKYDAAVKAHRDWTKCKADAEDAFRKGSQKGLKSQEADAKKLSEEAQRRIKDAKSPAEMQKIALELMAKQAELSKPTEQLAKSGEQQVVAKCGAEPVAPKAPPAERNRAPGGIAAYANALDRASAFCQIGPALIGRDGSVAIDPEIWKDFSGDLHDGLYTYSKAEAALLTKVCPRLNPVLLANNWKWSSRSR